MLRNIIWHWQVLFIMAVKIMNINLMAWKWPQINNADDCICGIPYVGLENNNDDKRHADPVIVKGEPVEDMRKYPWIVSLHSDDYKIEGREWGHCGGALIAFQFVLTAAHCVIRNDTDRSCSKEITEHCYLKPYELSIGILSADLKFPGDFVEVEKIIPFPTFQLRPHSDDIAVIKLKTPLSCSEHTRPVCLSDQDFLEEGDRLIIAGFGNIKGLPPTMSDVLREGVNEVKDFPNYCPEDKSEVLFCTFGEDQIACNGDSGSVSLYYDNNQYYAVGITAWGVFHCSLRNPMIYTKISGYYSFIEDSMNA